MIEDALCLHPKVSDVAVIGVPNEDFGEEVKAIVQPAQGVPQDDATRDELFAFSRERLAAYMIPRSIDFSRRTTETTDRQTLQEAVKGGVLAIVWQYNFRPREFCRMKRDCKSHGFQESRY